VLARADEDLIARSKSSIDAVDGSSTGT
jgi:hypothetical protein